MEEIYAIACTLLQDEAPKKAVLRTLCKAAEKELSGSLRADYSPQDCKDSFVMAAALIAAGHYAQAMDTGGVESFRIGEVSVNASAREDAGKVLREQAKRLMAPYTKNDFSFLGV